MKWDGLFIEIFLLGQIYWQQLNEKWRQNAID
jgi:hypothetical protein